MRIRIPCKYTYFNSLPSTRGDALESFTLSPSQFQLTPLCEGRLGLHLAKTQGQFQPTPLCEGRQIEVYEVKGKTDFNPLPSARGDRIPQQ